MQYTHAYIHRYIHTYIYTYIHTYIHITHTFIHTYKCQHLISALSLYASQEKYATKFLFATQIPWQRSLNGLTSERSFELQDFDKMTMGVCTTRHWQTSGRLVPEFNDCAVHTNVQHTHTHIYIYI